MMRAAAARNGAMPMRSRRARGFTVVELLACAAVALVLLGLALPTLVGGRRRARIATCAMNLMQIGKAMNGYLDDSGGVYPGGKVAGSGKPGDNVGWYNLLGKRGRWRLTHDPSILDTPAELRPLNKYLSERVLPQVACCPMDRGDSYLAQQHTLFDTVGSSYGYFYRSPTQIQQGTKVVFSGVWAIAGHRYGEVRYPDRKLLLADSIIQINRSANESYNWWHNSAEPLQVNVLFVDGHVDNLERKTGTQAVSPNGPTPAADQQIEALAAGSRYY
jgi:prepilin-type processing-associated H-X9-DG protein